MPASSVRNNLIEAIHLRGTLPEVFASQPTTVSDIWLADVTFLRGRYYMIEAASGTGKSSLCAYIYGARLDYNGSILFDDEPVSDFTIDRWLELRRRSLAYLPQELDLFPQLTAWQNIELKRSLTDFTPQAKVEEWLQRLGIADRRDFPVGKMSIGQQQRVGIIRALCQPFDFLLLDEPVSHLDEQNNRLAAQIILEEAESRGAGIIATSVGNNLALPEFLTLRL